MTENQAGLSALGMAYMRAHHARHAAPKIFDDFLAASLFGAEELAETDRTWAGLLQYIDPDLAATNPDPVTALEWVVQIYSPITLARSRYTEDSLETAIENGVRQYVILGAGLDTFAYRRPDLTDHLQVFELDHPATQAVKRARIDAQGWDHPANLHLVPTDFTQESVADALARSPYDPAQRSFFSWLGVSYYLARETALDTLRSVASIAAPGSAVVFDYMDPDAFDPAKSGKLVQLMLWMAAQLGEPIKTAFEPSALAADLGQVGLRLDEALDPAAIEARYFAGRADRSHTIEHFHFAQAATP